MQGLEGEELALCYFKDNKSDEPKGWVFAKDVTEIREDKVRGSSGRMEEERGGIHKTPITGSDRSCSHTPDSSLIIGPFHSCTPHPHPTPPPQVSFTIISPSRTFKLRAQTRAEHKLWTTGIRAICPDALFDSEGGGGGACDPAWEGGRRREGW